MTMDKKNMAQIANKVTKDVLAGFSNDDSGFKQMFSEMMADALKEATSPLIQKIDEQREMIEALQGGVEKVGKAMVVSEGPMTAGVAAELAARISEECFDFLEDPVVRVAGEDVPISVSVELEKNSVPGATLIADTARRLLA